MIAAYEKIPTALQDLRLNKLPIELALDFHLIPHTSFQEYLSTEGKTFFICNEDDIYEYMSDLRDSGAYEQLIEQTVKEVFHVLFQNRSLLLIFNDMMARALEFETDAMQPEEAQHELLTNFGILKRKPIPKWAKRAIYFRDRGQCVLCNKDLSGIVNMDNLENYDHIVPLARHGLNDVSNIQLLCKECNQIDKKDGLAITSNKYQSWYIYD